MVPHKYDAQSVLEPHQLLAVRSYKVMVFLGTKGVWTSSLVILEPGASPYLFKEDSALDAWAPSVKIVKASCLQSASNTPLDIKWKCSLDMQIVQL